MEIQKSSNSQIEEEEEIEESNHSLDVKIKDRIKPDQLDTQLILCQYCKDLVTINHFKCSLCQFYYCDHCSNDIEYVCLGCDKNSLVPSNLYIDKLSKILIHCINSSHGCTAIIEYIKLQEHEQKCEFNKNICQYCECEVNENHSIQECFKFMQDEVNNLNDVMLSMKHEIIGKKLQNEVQTSEEEFKILNTTINEKSEALENEFEKNNKEKESEQRALELLRKEEILKSQIEMYQKQYDLINNKKGNSTNYNIPEQP